MRHLCERNITDESQISISPALAHLIFTSLTRPSVRTKHHRCVANFHKPCTCAFDLRLSQTPRIDNFAFGLSVHSNPCLGGLKWTVLLSFGGLSIPSSILNTIWWKRWQYQQKSCAASD